MQMMRNKRTTCHEERFKIPLMLITAVKTDTKKQMVINCKPATPHSRLGSRKPTAIRGTPKFNTKKDLESTHSSILLGIEAIVHL
jgi:hypothetical protein